mmetsp:Transcript_10394/g.15570  ORF Transcript_10394/g.15570 Transcript_10394/m.15570 type:complete len:1057 (+) Transcript_10394:2-3172(+)
MKKQSSIHISIDGSGLESDDLTIKKIIESNPLLESFGNAKTSRNDNSSRFGKFMQLQFDARFAMVGSKCTTYLLEKSRVVGHGNGERGYHIFYQILAAPEEDKKVFGLEGKNPEDFFYLTCDRNEAKLIIEGKPDSMRYELTCKALDMIGVDSKKRKELFSTLAGILQLGQIDISADPKSDENSMVSDPKKLDAPCNLLGLEDRKMLANALCYRTVNVRGEKIETPNRPEVALVMRDSFTKALYSYLFDWLVLSINESTSAAYVVQKDANSKNFGTIALLDIFGFESFEVNRFEQLCINYANEKLQQKFTQDIFKTVQVEYEEEGIPWNLIDFSDNAEVLWLLESATGVLAVLNEECMLPKSSDERFISKLSRIHEDSQFYCKTKVMGLTFGIKHYAGIVYYTAEGFLDKNRDSIGDDSLNILNDSKIDLVREVFAISPPPHEPAGKLTRSKSSAVLNSLCSKFRTSLSELMETIRKTNVQYVRCIKPNSKKSAGIFENMKVVEQLRCAGVIEAIRISRAAYPNRIGHIEFMRRFLYLLDDVEKSKYEKYLTVRKKESAENETNGNEGSVVRFRGVPHQANETNKDAAPCKNFLKILLKGDETGFEMGRTKVYFRFGVLEKLEHQRFEIQSSKVTQLQALLRMCVKRKQFILLRAVAVAVQARFRCRIIQIRYKNYRNCIIIAQNQRRKVVAVRKLVVLRETKASSKIAASYRMKKAKSDFQGKRRAAILIQSLARMKIEMKRFKVLLNEELEARKWENQVRSLQKRLLHEQNERKKLEEQSRDLLRRLAAADKSKFAQALCRNSNESITVVNESSSPLQFTMNGLTPSTEAAATKFFKNDNEQSKKSFAMLDESSKMLTNMTQEMRKLREQNSALKEENSDLKRDKQKLIDASGIAHSAMQKMMLQIKSLSRNLAKEKAESARKTDQMRNKNEDHHAIRKTYEEELAKNKEQLKVMENMIRLVADSNVPIDQSGLDEITNRMAGMYQSCILRNNRLEIPEIEEGDIIDGAGGDGSAPTTGPLSDVQNLMQNVSSVTSALRFALFGKPRWGAVFDE